MLFKNILLFSSKYSGSPKSNQFPFLKRCLRRFFAFNFMKKNLETIEASRAPEQPWQEGGNYLKTTYSPLLGS